MSGQGQRGLRVRLRAFWRAFSLYLSVGLGAMVGGVLRWGVSEGMLHYFGQALPWGTLAVNAIGSFVIAFYGTLAAPEGRLFPGPRQRQFVMAGLCGGFTTFSVFSLEMLRYLQAQELLSAGIYVGASLPSWLVAAWLGHVLASRLNRIGG